MPTNSVQRTARFTWRGPTELQMRRIGERVVAIEQLRIRAGLTVDGTPAPPLKQGRGGSGYPARKQRVFGGRNLRDWWRTGRTLQSMQVLLAEPGRVVIGFVGRLSNLIVAVNNRRAKQWGLSQASRDMIRGEVIVQHD